MLDAHFRAVADEGGLPIVVYNVPGRTGANVEADTFLRLAEHPNVIAVKEASANIEQIAVICRDRPRDVAVLSGDDAATLAVLAHGRRRRRVRREQRGPGRARGAGRGLARRRPGRRRGGSTSGCLPLLRANFQGGPNPVPAKAAMLAMGLLGVGRRPRARSCRSTTRRASGSRRCSGALGPRSTAAARRGRAGSAAGVVGGAA